MSDIEIDQDLRVIVVDDDELMQQQVAIILKKIKLHDITLLGDGALVLDALNRGRQCDLIILDLNMPVTDGIKVMRDLALSDFTGALILFSGEDLRILKTAESLARDYQLNVIGSLTKPVTVAALVALLKNYKPGATKTKRQVIEMANADELAEAIKLQQIQPYYQPKVNADSQRIESVEVLARWIHPTKGVIPPIAFIPVAEDNDLIDGLTLTLLATCLAQYKQWMDQGHDFTLGFNLSAKSLSNVELPEILAQQVQASGLQCKQVILEITESQLMQNMTASLNVVTRLRLKGFGLAIDDFGTGYSSLSQLSKIPFTELKIDRAFVHGSLGDETSFAILELSQELAKNLNMMMVAEGVENQEDWDIAVGVGCDLVQGYFIAKPLPADKFLAWLKTQQ